MKFRSRPGFLGRRLLSADDKSSDLSSEHRERHVWPTAGRYETLAGEGHGRPPPSFGAPTLVWHLGIWHNDATKPAHAAKRNGDDEQRDLALYDRRNAQFIEEVSSFLESLQAIGRPLKYRPKTIEPVVPNKRWSGQTDTSIYWFLEPQPESVSFTLWWQDAAGRGRVNQQQEVPDVNDLCVRVHAQAHLDHMTISFFIDAGQLWNDEHQTLRRVYGSGEAPGGRRQTIFQHVERVRDLCRHRVINGDIDQSLDSTSDGDQVDALRNAADYLYDTIWQEFFAAFDIRWAAQNQNPPFHGELFANFRSMLMSVPGITTPDELRRVAENDALRDINRAPPLPPVPGSEASIGIGNPTRFDAASNEPNTILKTYWPFICDMAPRQDAQERSYEAQDFVACGVRHWHALYVSPLGSSINQRSSSDGAPRPMRSLVLTKGEPHEEQIGRLVERLNAVGTMRLFAMKDWITIRNAGTYIQLLGERLDRALSSWSESRAKIDEEYWGPWRRLKAADRRKRNRNPLRNDADDAPEDYLDENPFDDIRKARYRNLRNRYTARLNNLVLRTETDLIKLGAALDRIGKGGSGRLLYAINRARYYIEEFDRMSDSLDVGNVDTWVNYSEFVERGIQPVFDLIESTGSRLASLRERLQTVTEMVQTSALIIESEHTSYNTQILRDASIIWRLTFVGVLLDLLTSQVGTNLLRYLAQSIRVQLPQLIVWLTHIGFSR